MGIAPSSLLPALFLLFSQWFLFPLFLFFFGPSEMLECKKGKSACGLRRNAENDQKRPREPPRGHNNNNNNNNNNNKPIVPTIPVFLIFDLLQSVVSLVRCSIWVGAYKQELFTDRNMMKFGCFFSAALFIVRMRNRCVRDKLVTRIMIYSELQSEKVRLNGSLTASIELPEYGMDLKGRMNRRKERNC